MFSKKTVERFGRTIWGLLRPRTFGLMLAYVWLGALAQTVWSGQSLSFSDWGAEPWRLLVAGLVVGLVYINATSLNDWADFEIDQINLAGRSDRPLVTGLASRHQLLLIAGGSGFGAVLGAWLLGWGLLAVALVVLLVSWAYSLPPIQISRRGGWAQAVLPACYVVLPLAAGISAAGNLEIEPVVWWLFGALYLQFASRLMLKDYRDVIGDKQGGKMTFLLRHGNRPTVMVAGWCLIAAVWGLLAGLGSQLGPFSVPVIVAGLAGLAVLKKIAGLEVYSDQEAWLATFGRLMSGLTVALLLSLAAEAYGLEGSAVWLLAGLATIATLGGSARICRTGLDKGYQLR